MRQGVAESIIYPQLWRLSNSVTEDNLKKWIDCVYSISYAYESLLSLSTDVFWSIIVRNESFIHSFDSVLASLPKSFEEFLYHLLFLWEEPISVACNQLRTTILAVYSKILVASSADNISSKEWVVGFRELFPLSRSVTLWAHFPSRIVDMAKVYQAAMIGETNVSKDVDKFLSEFEEVTSHIDANLRTTVDAFTRKDPTCKRLQAAELLEEFVLFSLDLVTSHSIALQVLASCGMFVDCDDSLLLKVLVRLPDLVATMDHCVTLEVLKSCASFLPGYPIRRLLNTVARFEQSAANLAAFTLKTLPKNGRELSVIYGKIARSPRLIYLLNEHHNMQTLMANCSDRDKNLMNESIQTVCLKENESCLLRLSNQGLLQDLGNLNVLTSEQRKAVLNLREMLPHLSINYLHLCSRYFNYNVPLAVECILSRDSRLPMELRRVETVLDMAVDDVQNLAFGQPFSFTNQQRVLSTIVTKSRTSRLGKHEADNGSKKNYFKDAFSLALASSNVGESMSSTNIQEQAQLQPAANASEVLDEIIKDFERVKFGTLMAIPSATETEDGQRLIPMMTSKKYAGVQKLKTSDADKVAIRPTYEQFKYETQFSDDEYNDEYDDAFEQREFKVEPLNCEDTESENEHEAILPEVPGPEGNRYMETARNAGRGRGNVTRGAENSKGSQRRANPSNTISQANTATDVIQGDSTRGGRASSNTTYHGGRERQNKERNKNVFKQRGADRKLRGGMI